MRPQGAATIRSGMDSVGGLIRSNLQEYEKTFVHTEKIPGKRELRNERC